MELEFKKKRHICIEMQFFEYATMGPLESQWFPVQPGKNQSTSEFILFQALAPPGFFFSTHRFTPLTYTP